MKMQAEPSRIRKSLTVWLPSLVTVDCIYLATGPALRGGGGGAFRSRAPQMAACAPQAKIVLPKRGLCPEEINRLGDIGEQFEAKILVITLEFVGTRTVFS